MEAVFSSLTINLNFIHASHKPYRLPISLTGLPCPAGSALSASWHSRRPTSSAKTKHLLWLSHPTVHAQSGYLDRSQSILHPNDDPGCETLHFIWDRVFLPHPFSRDPDGR